jgi:CheY-like chemotaxis protein
MSKQVVVVDDDVVMARTLAKLLQRCGYDALPLHSGAAVLSYLSAQLPSLIILDHMMPEMDGLEVLRQMRCLPTGINGTPVVMFSAISDVGFQENALNGGAAEYWVKASFDFSTLKNRVEHLIGPA